MFDGLTDDLTFNMREGLARAYIIYNITNIPCMALSQEAVSPLLLNSNNYASQALSGGNADCFTLLLLLLSLLLLFVLLAVRDISISIPRSPS